MSPDSNQAPVVQLSAQTAEELAARAQAGSLPSFIELLGRFEGRIYNFLLRRVRLEADAEDLTQETFLRAWQNIQRYRPKYRFSTWLFTIASRLAVDHHRLKHRHWTGVSAKIQDTRADRATSSEDDPAHLATMRQDEGSVWSLAAALLTCEQHSALWLRYAEDLTPKEIARVLDRTQIAVRVMLFRARETLAAHLGEREPQLHQQLRPPIGPPDVLDRPAGRCQSIEGGVSCASR
jgi:RNA polymerase sigma-70 factor (ECF subfamily)